MRYLHPTDERTTVGLIPYSPQYQSCYRKMYNKCYHEMREALDIKPYDFIQDDSFFDEGTENIYLLTGSSGIIGSVALKGDEIDDLLVAPEYQGQGFGKQILLWALEHMSYERVFLHVADWNKRAVRLYEDTGFEIVETFSIDRDSNE